MKTKFLRITASLTMALGLSFSLAACGESNTPDGSSISEASESKSGIGSVYTEYVKLPDGRTVLCVANWHSTHGGISCDWDNAK